MAGTSSFYLSGLRPIVQSEGFGVPVGARLGVFRVVGIEVGARQLHVVVLVDVEHLFIGHQNIYL